MTEKEHIMSLNYTPDEAKPAVRPISLNIGLIFALLGLVTPLLVYLSIYLIIPTPRPGEDHTPGDGLGMMLLMIFGIIWWTIVEIISLASTLVGLARKETGRIKVAAMVSTALSLVLIVSVYVGAFAFVQYVSNETKRYESSKNL
jgi:hypothetical protein